MMTKLLSPKLDIVFKKLFVSEPALLLDLINQIFDFYHSPTIRHLTIRNPEILPEQPEDKKIILDILAEDENGRQLDIEMQAQNTQNYPQRTLFYLSRVFSKQLSKGQEYQALRPVLGIHFIDFILYSRPQWQYCFEWRERHDPSLCYSDYMRLFLFELPKIQHHHNRLEQWLFFFNHPETETTMPFTNPMIQKAQQTLENLSRDEEFVHQALAREIFLHDQATRLYEAREEGRQEGREEGERNRQIAIAKNMLAEGLEAALVMKVTGLTAAEIEALRQD